MLKKLRITDDEATAICDKNQYGEATFIELIKLNLHFLRSKDCYTYTKQNNIMTRLFKGHAKTCKELKHCMSYEDKEDLKKALEKFKV